MSDPERAMADDSSLSGASGDAPRTARRRYASPVLTKYGRVDDLNDAGVVGEVPSIVPESA